MSGDTHIVLEMMVPICERSIPFFRLQDCRQKFEATVREFPGVDDIQVVNTRDEETLYALDCRIGSDTFFEGIMALEAHILEATGSARTWAFELRFPTHEALADFQEFCSDATLPIDIRRIYNPTKPDAGPWYGLTASQREVLTHTVETGYYTIPRRTSTQDLAEKFAISDQAMTERLRRGIEAVVTNTLLLSDRH